MRGRGYRCSGCGVMNYDINQVWAERVEFRKGDHTRKDVHILRHWCDVCQRERAQDIVRELTGMDSLI